MNNKLPFPLEYFSDDFTYLRISFLHWLIMVFSAKGALVFLGTLMPKVSVALEHTQGRFAILDLALALPALVVLTAALYRHATAPSLLQKIWRWGRYILLLGLTGQLALDGHKLVYELLRTGGRPMSAEFWYFHPLLVYLEVWFFFVVMLSKRIRWTFLTHPAWETPALFGQRSEPARSQAREAE